jgi:hypothetical protein
MRLKNTNFQKGRNLGIIRGVLAGFPEKDLIRLEYIGGLNHLVWTEGMERHCESISVPIPSVWLDEPGFESKLAATSKNFAGWVLKAKNDRRNESSRRNMVEK